MDPVSHSALTLGLRANFDISQASSSSVSSPAQPGVSSFLVGLMFLCLAGSAGGASTGRRCRPLGPYGLQTPPD